ncbi:similar to Saccharomyces cerevisiae YCR065W HCM1 Forkhead transcription factor that drives S- phase specific expression of genes involved in chromosome segregation, spindle dynamics, and budding [Maudiozyma barnettii]|uniref:Similar to Saccharomyces cerevisiae YCR065W HCM1 Forkhead transcription factor that drives S- phase specific expression of genes involved in chromosome segregation, spindle dynamics, and budding n=1 Tax=Maudiozyma barnettii TaxID=61262 RepID=A0A8H2ZHQ9_9SACH|nr:Hcm1p [Kazachstania barnettii]CAB4254762.1 similar to Saccharomyces cerevisiae YCR065W HCM1 Forkhead transcription factor that drives S- phase specific expression of genes involved in chromosome segregation, spindle dynamics, and budding [Kazachstania barnettii]CAD1782887.1 similar to Saccharomyces cerevisiae YCR065W HCM1 Forkhead transcription factor that drives S- phase specific expression of genes involved in chromosome segregation, spindle dynamics, and budding [Kazachstania barnettii]
MEVEAASPSYDAAFNASSPLASSRMKKPIGTSLDFDLKIEDVNDDIITPPNSTVRKNKKQLVRKLDDGKEPMSPIQSSPIAPTAKRQRSEGCPRSNGNLSLTEVLLSLEKRKLNNELDKKPPYSYAILICLAILQSREGRLTLSQIYQWISSHFTFYKLKDASWQNSIRHNLSLNEAFIKTQKSSDGKGHFWEVKPLSMPKFFKGDTEGYVIIRQRIAQIDQYFEVGSPLTASNSESEDSASITSSPTPGIEHSASTSILSAPSIIFTTEDQITMAQGPNVHTPVKNNRLTHKLSYNDITKSDMKGTVFGNNMMRRNHTTLGFKSTSDAFLVPPSKEFVSFNEYLGNNNLSTSNSRTGMLSSPQNSKRYIGSFNSSFEELSPRPLKTAESSITSNPQGLLGPFTNSAISPANSDKFTQLLPSGTHNNISNIESEQLNLLKTPELKRSQSLERSPNRFMATPKDNETLLKRWQTPSHLFEDIYSSPIFKAMSTSSKVSATPGGSTLLKKFSPSKVSGETQNEPIKSKLACGGLFGVDVYSVWQRATEMSSLNDANTLDATLERPFKANTDSKL